MRDAVQGNTSEFTAAINENGARKTHQQKAVNNTKQEATKRMNTRSKETDPAVTEPI